MSFLERWHEAVERKGSVLCAGLDPAQYEMGRGEKGLPEEVDKISWSLQYMESVARHVAAVKPNIQYWKSHRSIASTEALRIIAEKADELGLVYIDDSKLADIGSTNDAGMFNSLATGRGGAVTLAPYAGNMAQAAQQGRARDIGLITMCLMSNSEYEDVKNSLVKAGDGYESEDIILVSGVPYVRKYVQLAHDAAAFGLDGIVIGAPSKDNHITEDEIARVRRYVGDDMLVLMPGVGAQGGDADLIWKYFDPNNVIVNVGRSLMLPAGMNSTPQDQDGAAEHYKNLLNRLRTS